MTTTKRTYQIVNQNGVVVGSRDDFETALRWAMDYLEGRWSIRTIEDGKCVIERNAKECMAAK